MKTAIYARKSTDDNDRNEDNKSVTRQVERARDYAKARGWTVADEHVFTDDGISGGEFINRPGFSRLMEAAKRHEVRAIIMSEPSRLGRDMIRTSYYLTELLDSGVEIHYYLTGEQERGDDPTHRLISVIRNYAAEDHRMRSSQRSRDALERKALKGCNTGGRVYGYRNVWVMDDSRRVIAPAGTKKPEAVARTEYEIDEQQVEVVRAIYRMRADGHGEKKIAKTLNGVPRYAALSKFYFGGEQPPAPRSEPGSWAPSSIHEILRNERYTGVIPWGEYRKSYRGGTKVRVRQDEYERVPAPRLRIVSDELWRAVRECEAASTRTYLTHTNGERFGRAGPGRESKYLLTALARCKCCKANIIAEPRQYGPPGNRKKVAYYGCSGHKNRGAPFCPNDHLMRMEKMDEAVLKAIEEQVLKPEWLAWAVDQALALNRERRCANPNRLSEIEAEQRKLRREVKNLNAALAGGRAPQSTLEEIRTREAHIEALDREQSALQSPEPSEVDDARLKRALCECAARFRDTMRADVPGARRALRELLDGPLTFNPVMVEGKKAYAFEGRTRIGALLDPLYLKMASPRGPSSLINTLGIPIAMVA